MPTVAGVFGVTVTTNVPVVIAPSVSVTFSVTLFAPIAALQSAATFAVIVPLVLVMPVTVMPVGNGPTVVTTRLPGGSSASLTVAIVETVPGLPCCLITVPATAGVIDGGVLAMQMTLELAEATITSTLNVPAAVAPFATT